MLCSLHIRNYVLIDSLDTEFPEGLVIITGQTGAGKSILLGALSLLSGARADASLIGRGADSCVVEAEFRTGDDDVIRTLLDDNDIEAEEDGLLTVRRVIHSSGRSRSFVNDSPVPLQLLSSLGERLIDIHSQHQSLLLSDSSFQLEILDRFAQASDTAAECRRCHRELLSLRRELEEAEEKIRKAQSESSYMQAQFDRIDQAGLRDGEIEELEEEQRALENAESIKESLSSAGNVFEGTADGRTLDAALKEARRSLEHAARFMPAVAPLCERLDSARIELDDIASEVSAAFDTLTVSPRRLEEVQERLSLLHSLLKKNNCGTLAELIAIRDSYSEALFDVAALEDRKKELQEAVLGKETEFGDICGKLHEMRADAAPRMAAEITSSLHSLELGRSVFSVDLSPCQPSERGIDEVRFRFSADGTSPADVRKCASGGELSRIMLSLKAMMARLGGMPTLVFDEIDTGVSGSVADAMGAMICSMGQHQQVFSITHLPQVAAKGQAHYVVTKVFGDDGARSTITKVTGEQRVAEVARLLSGATVTPEALANARVLLSSN